MPDLGLYIHWPFCISKCPYCDFNSHVRAHIDERLWRDAYLRELSHFHERTEGRPLTSVFFGGGTPSLMAPETVADILDFIKTHWKTPTDLEITLEANPQSSDQSRFRALAEAGINRLSLGIQSLDEAVLKKLGRAHDPPEARAALEAAASTFDRYSFDLIYTHPWHTRAQWKDQLSQALVWAKGHLSLYQLTIEKGTPFHLAFQRGELVLPEAEESARFYIDTRDLMAAHGYESYEVSNYAQEGQESRHNLIYWRYQDYIGIGPGAHGRLTEGERKVATRQHRAPEEWLRRVSENGTGLKEELVLSPHETVRECLLMGLRLREGIPWDKLRGLNDEKISSLMQEGYLDPHPTRLTLTHEGRLRLNAILEYLTADLP